jgi:hypothetical protein
MTPFEQGAAAATGPGLDDDLEYRLAEAQRGAVERGALAEEHPQRGADRYTRAVQREPNMPQPTADGRTYPVSFHIGGPRRHQPEPVQPDRVLQRLDHAEDRLDRIDDALRMIGEHLFPKDPS